MSSEQEHRKALGRYKLAAIVTNKIYANWMASTLNSLTISRRRDFSCFGLIMCYLSFNLNLLFINLVMRNLNCKSLLVLSLKLNGWLLTKEILFQGLPMASGKNVCKRRGCCGEYVQLPSARASIAGYRLRRTKKENAESLITTSPSQDF